VSTFRRKYRQEQSTRKGGGLRSTHTEDKCIITDDKYLPDMKLIKNDDDEGSVVPGDVNVSCSVGEDNVVHAVTQQKTFQGLTEKVAKFAQCVSPNQNSKSQEGELQVEESTPFIPKSQKTNLLVGITSLPISKEKSDLLKVMYYETESDHKGVERNHKHGRKSDKPRPYSTNLKRSDSLEYHGTYTKTENAHLDPEAYCMSG
jgi:hypothetical protein